MRRTNTEVITLRETTIGRKSQAVAITKLTSTRAQRKGLCTAVVLGVISQKIKTINEMRTVEINSPKEAENCSANAVAMLEATITATLFTTKIVESSVLGSFNKRSIFSACLSPSSTRFLSLMRLIDVRAVSVAEATAQRIKATIIKMSCSQVSADNCGI